MGSIHKGGTRAGHVPSISWARTLRMAARINLRSSYSPAPRNCERQITDTRLWSPGLHLPCPHPLPWPGPHQ